MVEWLIGFIRGRSLSRRQQRIHSIRKLYSVRATETILQLFLVLDPCFLFTSSYGYIKLALAAPTSFEVT